MLPRERVPAATLVVAAPALTFTSPLMLFTLITASPLPALTLSCLLSRSPPVTVTPACPVEDGSPKLIAPFSALSVPPLLSIARLPAVWETILILPAVAAISPLLIMPPDPTRSRTSPAACMTGAGAAIPGGSPLTIEPPDLRDNPLALEIVPALTMSCRALSDRARLGMTPARPGPAGAMVEMRAPGWLKMLAALRLAVVTAAAVEIA